jgi:hypothetical protein
MLELFFTFCLCLRPSIMVMGGGHVHAVNIPVLGFVVRAPLKFLPVVVNSGTLLGDAPQFGSIPDGLLGSICTATLVTVIQLSGSLNFLLKLVEVLGGLLQLSGEENNLHILVIAVHPSPVCNHVLVHLVKTGENGGLIGHPSMIQRFFKVSTKVTNFLVGEVRLAWKTLVMKQRLV